MKPLYSIFCVLILLFQLSHAGRNSYSSDCKEDLFYSDKSVSDIESLEGLAQLFHSLRIYSAGGFYTAKRDRYLPEGVPRTLKELLESYDELQVHTKPQDNLEILWGRVRELRLAEADTAEKREMTDAEFQVLWRGVRVIEGEEDELEEDLLEERPSTQAKSGKRSSGNQSSTRNAATAKGRTTQQGGTVVWNWKKNRNRKSNSAAKLREERKIKILLILMEDDLMTLVKLAKELNLSKRAIDYLTAELRSEGRLSRKGDTGRRGNWVIPLEEREKLKLLLQKEDILVEIRNGGDVSKENNPGKQSLTQQATGVKEPPTKTGERGWVWGTTVIDKSRNRVKASLQEQREREVLLLTAENEGITLADLARKSSFKRGTLDQLVAKLEAEGRLTRREVRIGSRRIRRWTVPEEEKRKLGLLLQEEETEESPVSDG